MNRDCFSCTYYDPIEDGEEGFCRRFAPRPKTAPRNAMTDSSFDVVAWWPVVLSDDGCGEFEARE